MNEAMIKIEIERIVNLVQNFGWSKTKEEVSASSVTLTFSKPLPASVVEGGEGAD